MSNRNPQPWHERGSATSVAPKVKAPKTSPAGSFGQGPGVAGFSGLPTLRRVEGEVGSQKLAAASAAKARDVRIQRATPLPKQPWALNPIHPKPKPESPYARATVLGCSAPAWPELLHFGLGPGIGQSRGVPGPEIRAQGFRDSRV